MKPVTHPLKLQMKRGEVGDLQQALSFLGLTIASEEKNRVLGPRKESQPYVLHPWSQAGR